MNPQLRIEAHTHKVSQQSENIYTNEWWSTQDLIVNALDNVEARLYVDSRCVYNRIPLLESGTMGTKGHVQVIVPHKTANYGSTRDPPEAGIPFCTLKSFPSQIDHCIQWARDKFNTLFTLKAQEANQFVEDARDPDFLAKVRAKRPRQKEMKRAFNLLNNRPRTSEDCVALARKKFEAYFNHSVQQLLHAFPLDKKNDDGSSCFAHICI
jgi:ubiquitin-activating enzyme E1-like protein 2